MKPNTKKGVQESFHNSLTLPQFNFIILGGISCPFNNLQENTSEYTD